MKRILVIILIVVLTTECNKIKELETSVPQEEDIVETKAKDEGYNVNERGMTIEERYSSLADYTWVKVEEKSFGEFLRKERLKPYGERVLYYDGREKNSEGVYDSVFDVDIGNRDLHQCADAIMLLRGEYLYSQGLYDETSFNFVSGFKAEYKKWMEG